MQKKGFTKWANVYLGMRKRRIEDLYTDFNDGVNLIHLLEVIGQEPIGRKWVAKPKVRRVCPCLCVCALKQAVQVVPYVLAPLMAHTHTHTQHPAAVLSDAHSTAGERWHSPQVPNQARCAADKLQPQ